MTTKTFLHIGGVLHGKMEQLPEKETQRQALFCEPQPASLRMLDTIQPKTFTYTRQTWLDKDGRKLDLMVESSLKDPERTLLAHDALKQLGSALVPLYTKAVAVLYDNSEITVCDEDLELLHKIMALDPSIATRVPDNTKQLLIVRYFATKIGILKAEMMISRVVAECMAPEQFVKAVDHQLLTVGRKALLSHNH